MQSKPLKKNTKVRREFSAGGVVIKDKREVLLIKNPSNIWTFPKGHIEKGETKEQAAVREVKEETNIDAQIVTYLGEISYFFTWGGVRIHKTVYFFLMKYIAGIPVPSWEVKDARFFPIEKVEGILKYRGDKEIFLKAMEKLNLL
ncbi:MAG: NUDIX hydrolase [Aquificaceae bacterium]|nr:MAG: NUDIX hydrolase [Aquificaceae bacterium]